MNGRPTRATAAGRAYLALRKLAREQGRPTEELLHLYALEGFLERLQESALADKMVLKGGVLMAAFDARRPTRDVDLSAPGLGNDNKTVLGAIQEILSVQVDDGLDFDPSSAEARTIREGGSYSGIRVTLLCRLASAELHFMWT